MPFNLPFFAPITLIFTVVSLFISFLTGVAQATISIVPQNGNSLGLTGKLYYFVYMTGAGLTSGPTSPAFVTGQTLDLSQSLSSDPNLTNIFWVQISSNVPQTLTGTTQAVVMAIANASGVSTVVPIAGVNDQVCSASNSSCGVMNLYPGDINVYYGAFYAPTQTVKIGFYPQDWCRVFAAQKGTQAQGCNNSTVITPTAGNPTNISVNFVVTTTADSNPATIPTPSPTGTPYDTMTTPLNIVFQIDTPTLSCPSQSSLISSYIPGDGQIFLNTSLFGMGPGTGDAPAAQLIVVGQDQFVSPNSTPDTSSSYNSGTNSLVFTTPLLNQSNVPITGFTNSTPSATHDYTLSFMMQDDAGIIVPPPGGSCLLSPVETGSISGFLNKGNCFIATASFNSAEAIPVEMLREFRDQVLFSFSWGRAFVDSYYRWSPQAAAWLLDHSEFRIVSLYFLLSIELFAWLTLHPSAWALFLLLGFGLAFTRRGEQ